MAIKNKKERDMFGSIETMKVSIEDKKKLQKTSYKNFEKTLEKNYGNEVGVETAIIDKYKKIYGEREFGEVGNGLSIEDDLAMNPEKYADQINGTSDINPYAGKNPFVNPDERELASDLTVNQRLNIEFKDDEEYSEHVEKAEKLKMKKK